MIWKPSAFDQGQQPDMSQVDFGLLPVVLVFQPGDPFGLRAAVRIKWAQRLSCSTLTMTFLSLAKSSSLASVMWIADQHAAAVQQMRPGVSG